MPTAVANSPRFYLLVLKQEQQQDVKEKVLYLSLHFPMFEESRVPKQTHILFVFFNKFPDILPENKGVK